MNETGDFVTLNPTQGGPYAALALGRARKRTFTDFQRELEERRNRTPASPTEKWLALDGKDAVRLSELIVNRMRRICCSRAMPDSKSDQVDFDFWHKLTVDLLTSDIPATDIVAVPAGGGKSTWLEALLITIGELIRNIDPLATRIGGILLVKERVEELNRLHDAISKLRDNRDIFIPLQAPSRSGVERELCRAQSAVPCDPKCRYAGSCELRRFREVSESAPILGITQAMFLKLRREGRLESVLRWMPDTRGECDGLSYPRTLILFDEKYEFSPVDRVNLRTISAAKVQLEQLEKDGRISDRKARFYESALFGRLELLYQQKRREMNRETTVGGKPITLSTLRLTQEEIASYAPYYAAVRNQLLAEDRFRATPEMKEVLSVFTRLYAGGTCFASRAGDNFTIFGESNALAEFTDAKTVIFDATAAVDEDYAPIRETARVCDARPQRQAHELVFHIYPDAICNVSRSAYGSQWKLPALVDFVTEIMARQSGKFLLFTYKDYSEELAERLDDQIRSRIPLMQHPETGNEVIPYHGGTHGSNAFHTCDAVIFLGYPRLNGQEYLQRALAAYGSERILEEMRAFDPHAIDDSFLEDPRTLLSIRRYIAHHLSAEVEQAIYRSKHRNADCCSTVDVYFPYPDEEMVKLLRERFPEADVRIEATPSSFRDAKARNRRYKGSDTAKARLIRFMEDETQWMSSTFPVRDIKKQLGISDSFHGR